MRGRPWFASLKACGHVKPLTVCLSLFLSPQASLSVYAANTQPDQPQLNHYLYPCLPFHPACADEVLRLQCPFREDNQIPAGDAWVIDRGKWVYSVHVKEAGWGGFAS